MEGFRVPAGDASAEFVEKKSRFIGNIFLVSSAEQAAGIVKSIHKKLWDASHNVYAYSLENGVMRFSDDGEPQGTAGLPTLEVLKKERVVNALCVTTRYFGGTLLGAGGLVRAYSHACKLALDAAGIAVMTPMARCALVCDYDLLDAVRKQLASLEANESGAQYTDRVELTVELPEIRFDELRERIVDITRGRCEPICRGVFMVPVKARPE